MISQKLKPTDYAYMWWANGIRDLSETRRFNILTGSYGLSIDPKKINIDRLGPVSGISFRKAGEPNNDIINGLTEAGSAFWARTSGKRYEAKEAPDRIEDFHRFEDYPRWVCREYGTEYMDYVHYNYRTIESGRLVQRFDIYDIPMTNGTDEAPFRGHVEFCALPEYFSLIFHLMPSAACTADVGFSLTLDKKYRILSELCGETCRSVSLRASDGSGFTFVLPVTPFGIPTVYLDGNTLYFELNEVKLDEPDPNGETLTLRSPFWYRQGFNVIIIPSKHATLHDAERVLALEDVTATAVQYNSADKIEYPTVCKYNQERGILEIHTDKFNVNCANDEHKNDVENVRFRLRNPRGYAVRVPVCFATNDNKDRIQNIGGQMCFAPILCESDGTPIGCYVQNSMNWHAEFRDIGAVLYDKAWKRMTTIIEIPAGEEVEYCLKVAYQKWGDVTKVSHSQLCIIGWGANTDWEVLAFGSIFENTCYEPEGIQRYDGAMIDDCRALYCRTGKRGEGRIWQATENVGGGNFLVLETDGVRRYQTTVKTAYIKPGPCSSKTVHRYVTSDGSIEAEITVGANATDDCVRVRHCMKYRVLKDTKFSRLAFYQLGSDAYNDHQTRTAVCGNESGLLYSVDAVYPVVGEDKIYREGETGIALTGDVPWVGFCGEGLGPNILSNRMVTVRHWKAILGGKAVEYPYASVTHTLAQGQVEGLGWEIAPPPELDELKNGDYVELELEYVIVPQAFEEYYGPEQELMSRALGVTENGLYEGSGEDNWRSLYFAAVKNDISVAVSRGTLLHENPVRIQCEDERAEFTVCGGMGYLGVAFCGLPTYRGYCLEQYINGEWVELDRTVHGNDFWQADTDVITGDYELTYTIRRNADESVDHFRFGKKGS